MREAKAARVDLTLTKPSTPVSSLSLSPSSNISLRRCSKSMYWLRTFSIGARAFSLLTLADSLDFIILAGSLTGGLLLVEGWHMSGLPPPLPLSGSGDGEVITFCNGAKLLRKKFNMSIKHLIIGLKIRPSYDTVPEPKCETTDLNVKNCYTHYDI